MAAMAAAREGMHVVLLEPGNHLGGMLTGGLSATDVGNPTVIGGDALEFFERVGHYYDMQQYDQKVSWRFEPHVGEATLRSMLQDAKVDIRFHERMREKDGVQKSDGRILTLTTEDGDIWKGKVFIDATYEGDLMAASGVSFAWGREGVAQYGRAWQVFEQSLRAINSSSNCPPTARTESYCLKSVRCRWRHQEAAIMRSRPTISD